MEFTPKSSTCKSPKKRFQKKIKNIKFSLDIQNLLWYSSQALSCWCSSVGRAADL